ncbi:hypothetical protein EDB83DRAFT_2433661 [Lactarius deliciosus]|nr:hypothetical protein EDB83DRAFT_2433661 [Lactarius deliciosus]
MLQGRTVGLMSRLRSGRRLWLRLGLGLRACARFVDNGMTTPTLVLSLEASACVSFADRRVVVAAIADADAVTLG